MYSSPYLEDGDLDLWQAGKEGEILECQTLVPKGMQDPWGLRADAETWAVNEDEIYLQGAGE